MTNVTCAIILFDNKVLVAQRSEIMKLPLKWEFPGGKLEKDESEEDCIIREIKEELQVEISIIKKLKSITHSYSDVEIELIPFVCSLIEGDINLTEHIEYRWLNKEALSTIDLCEADSKIISEL